MMCVNILDVDYLYSSSDCEITATILLYDYKVDNSLLIVKNT